jgi:prevent-host-death family protein
MPSFDANQDAACSEIAICTEFLYNNFLAAVESNPAMLAVKITDLRQNLPSWIARARAGERIGVSVHGEIVAELVPAVDRKAEAKRALATLRKTAVLGDLITPVDAEWTSDLDNIDIAEIKPRTAPSRKIKSR